MFDISQVGIHIARLRKAAGLTQVELADRLGVTFQAVSNWERGVSMPDIGKLEELSTLLNAAIDDILGNHRVSVITKNLLENRLTPDIRLEEATEMGPFLHEKEMDALLEGAEDLQMDAEELAAAAPFLSDGFLNRYARSKLDAGADLHSLARLLPFLGDAFFNDAIRQIEQRGGDVVHEGSVLLPFLSNETLDSLAQAAFEKGEGLHKLAPFLSNETLRLYAQKIYAAQGLGGLLPLVPFLDDECLNSIAAQLYAKGGFGAIRSLLPFLDSDTIESILQGGKR